MSGHTPGPWEVLADLVLAGPVTTVGVGLVTHRGGICSMDDLEATDEECSANASLISAAPELLEALRPLADLDLRPDGFDQRDDDQPIYARDSSVITVGDVRRAIAAIAKATGGAA